MFSEVLRESAQKCTWLGGLRETLVESGDGLADVASCTVGTAARALGVLFLELGDGFEVAESLGFDGFGFVGVVENCVEFFFFAEEGAHGLGVVEGEAAFLEAGVAFEGGDFAGFGVDDLGEGELVAVDFGDFGHEIEGVDGSFVGVGEEPGDVEEAAFVLQDRVVAVVH